MAAFTPNQQRGRALLAGDREEFLLRQHEQLGPHHIVDRPGLRAAMLIVQKTVELAGAAATQLPSGDPVLVKARLEADYHVLPPHYMYLRLSSSFRVHSNDPGLTIATKRGLPISNQFVGKQIAIHRFGLNLADPQDARIYAGALAPDTRATTPVVISMPELVPDTWRFDSAARVPADAHPFIDPTLLLR
jgi:hypothetical protein